MVFTWNVANRQSVTERINPNFTVKRIRGVNLALRPLFSEYPLIPSLDTEISSCNPGLIDAHSHLFLPSFQAIRIAKKLGIPSVLTVHGVMAQRDNVTNLLQEAYLRLVASRALADATVVVCLTKRDADTMAHFGCPQEKIRIVPNAVDAELFSPGPHRDEKTILWVGRMVPEKGVRHLAEVIDLVIEGDKTTRFVIIGDGPLRRLLHDSIAGRDWQNRVSILGRQSREVVSEWMGRASVFLFTSSREGFPKVILEALSSGLPIVSFDLPGLNGVVEHGLDGLMVPPGDTAAMAKSVLSIVGDSDLGKKLGQHGRKRVLDTYTWELVLDLLSNVYLEALSMV
ncbi:MAG: glycosyltransferase family 4 protein [Thaumarchaeota archaeon]|nr:glycosyltransferase family 4 protein [Nitrososphaerota archaeon]